CLVVDRFDVGAADLMQYLREDADVVERKRLVVVVACGQRHHTVRIERGTVDGRLLIEGGQFVENGSVFVGCLQRCGEQGAAQGQSGYGEGQASTQFHDNLLGSPIAPLGAASIGCSVAGAQPAGGIFGAAVVT